MRFPFAAAALAVSVSSAAAQFIPPNYIADVVDAASYTPGLAPGGLFVVRGYFPLPSGLRVSSLPLQEKFNDVTVSLKPTAGGSSTNAFIYHTYSAEVTQIAAVLPSSVTPGKYDVTVTSAGTTVFGSGRARVIANKFRSLTNNQQGFGLAVIQNYVDASRLDRNMFVAGNIGPIRKGPATPGQTVILWGLGLGRNPTTTRLALLTCALPGPCASPSEGLRLKWAMRGGHRSFRVRTRSISPYLLESRLAATYQWKSSWTGLRVTL
jgi:uncharacterized protein (TIGR03437 family)